jgi:hypothetical protein
MTPGETFPKALGVADADPGSATDVTAISVTMTNEMTTECTETRLLVERAALGGR